MRHLQTGTRPRACTAGTGTSRGLAVNEGIDNALSRLVAKRDRCRNLLSSTVPESLRGAGETVTAICAALDRQIDDLFELRSHA